MKMKHIKQIPLYTFLIIVSFFCIFPFLWMFFGATMTHADIIAGDIKFGGYISENFAVLTSSNNYYIAFRNSTIAAIITTFLALIISSLAAYGFEIFRSKGKDKLFNFLLLTMMIPFAALLVPLYKVILILGISGSLAAVILPAIATVFMVFFFKQSFKQFPREIIQSARIDGANELRIFFSIVIPTMKATYAAAAILTFTTSWNNFLWPLITLTGNEVQTLPLNISTLGTSYFPDNGVILLAIVIATIPSIIVFFALQKHFVAGMTGAVK